MPTIVTKVIKVLPSSKIPLPIWRVCDAFNNSAGGYGMCEDEDVGRRWGMLEGDGGCVTSSAAS